MSSAGRYFSRVASPACQSMLVTPERMVACAYEQAFVIQHRQRDRPTSWGHIAHMLGRPEPVVRQLYDHGYVPAHPVRPLDAPHTAIKTEPPKRPSYRPFAKTVSGGTREHLVLAHLLAGVVSPQALGDLIDRPPTGVRTILHALVNKGFAVHAGPATWHINQSGRNELERLAREADRG